jgi:ABC-type nitrate/sulfonate/bicarbonate transport system permease component
MYNESAKLIFRTCVGMLIGAAAGIGVAYLLGWLPS